LDNYKKKLDEETEKLSEDIGVKVDEYNQKQEELNQVNKNFSVADNIADLKKEALNNLGWYYGYLVFALDHLRKINWG